MQIKAGKLFSIIAILAMMVVAVPAPGKPVVAAPVHAISLTGTTYTQDFDTLANTGTTNTTLPSDWLLTESGGGTRDNEQYAANDGSSNIGDTYSYGTSSAVDRALGGLQSGTLIPIFGAQFVNDTGAAIESLSISYTGEQWRLGTAGRTDNIDFQLSTDATSLTTGSWIDYDDLDFSTPNTATTGAKDGNSPVNRTAISYNIPGLSIANGSAFWIRWTDLDASGSDDGLAVDDFSLTASGGSSLPNLTINDVTLAEGDVGTTIFTFTVSLSSPAPTGGVVFDIATTDGTATTANSDYVANSINDATIAEGASTATFDVTINGDTIYEPDETFNVNVTNVSGATVADGVGLGTIWVPSRTMILFRLRFPSTMSPSPKAMLARPRLPSRSTCQPRPRRAV